MRWEEERDPEQPTPSRRWGVAAGIAGLGVALVAAAVLSSGSPPPESSGSLAVQAVDEPTGRGGLPHRLPAPSTPAPTPAPAPVVAPLVTEAAATAPATAVAPSPAATLPVGRLGQPCDVRGTSGVSADGGPLVCQGGKGNGAPRWRKG